MNEKALQTFLFKRAADHGVYARKMQAVGRPGFPDVMLLWRSRVVFVELKSPTGKGRLSKKQELEIARLRANGAKVYVVDSREGVENVIEKIKSSDFL